MMESKLNYLRSEGGFSAAWRGCYFETTSDKTCSTSPSPRAGLGSSECASGMVSADFAKISV